MNESGKAVRLMSESVDGTYRYAWRESGLEHSVYFKVQGGRIIVNPSQSWSAPGQFETLAEFTEARLSADWKHIGDRCLQVSLPQEWEQNNQKQL